MCIEHWVAIQQIQCRMNPLDEDLKSEGHGFFLFFERVPHERKVECVVCVFANITENVAALAFFTNEERSERRD
jgi:hypothetical protein